MYINICILTHTYKYVTVYVQMSRHTQICVMQIYIHLYMHVYIYTCTHICMYIYVYIYEYRDIHQNVSCKYTFI